MISKLVIFCLACYIAWTFRTSEGLIVSGIMMLTIVLDLMIDLSMAKPSNPEPRGIGQAPPHVPRRPPARDVPFPDVPEMHDEKFGSK